MTKVLWFTGLSGAGKTTIAEALAARLRAQGKTVELIDGDTVRQTFHQDLGFSKEDITKNQRLIIRLITERLGKFDYILVPVIAPLKALREEARAAVGEGFFEVYVHSSHETRAARDPKGLYKKAAAGEITDFIGYDGVPYEAPEHPDLTINTDIESLEQGIAKAEELLMGGSKVLLFLYETEQIPTLADAGAAEIIAFDYTLELELAKRGIGYTPLRSIVSSHEEPAMTRLTQRAAIDWYKSPELSFFVYKGVQLGAPHTAMLNFYFGGLLYYLAVIDAVLTARAPQKVIIPETHRHAGELADPTAAHKERLVQDVAVLLCERRGIAYEVIPAPSTTTAARPSELVARVIVTLVNMLSGLRPRRKLRILSTDPWSRIAPFMRHLPEAELVMTRRRELRAMSFGDIWRTRARFHHRLDFADAGVRALARKTAGEFAKRWDTLGDTPEISTLYEYRGISYWPIARQVLHTIVVDRSADDVQTIESIQKMLERYRINRTLTLSTKGYNNLVAQTAERLGVPSLEVQHGLEVTDPGSPHAALFAHKIAAYGPLTKKHYESFGVESDRIIPVGSPRFDSYARATYSTESQDVLVVPPTLHIGSYPDSYSSYAAQSFLEDAAEVSLATSINCVIRPRPGGAEPLYYRQETLDLFGGRARLGRTEALADLLAQSAFVISSSSTVVLEAMLAHKPVVLYLPRFEERDFDDWATAGAVRIARTKDELERQVRSMQDPAVRAELVSSANKFLQQNFMMDGRAAERVANLLRTLV